MSGEILPLAGMNSSIKHRTTEPDGPTDGLKTEIKPFIDLS